MLLMKFAILFSLICLPLVADYAPGTLLLTPPNDWKATEKEQLPKNVQFMIVGNSSSDYPPSLNLAIEPYPGEVRDYLQLIKRINRADGNSVKEWGTVQTKAGKVTLVQVDLKNNWGDITLLHGILIHDHRLHLVTAASLKKEFFQHLQEFTKVIKSMQFTPDLFSLAGDPLSKKIRSDAENLFQKHREIQKSSTFSTRSETFHSPHFQEEVWIPFSKELEALLPENSTLRTRLSQKLATDLTVEYE